MNGDRDGFSPPRTQELGPISGTIYNSEKNDTLRTLFCQEASLAIVVVRSGRSPPRKATASFRFDTIPSSAPSSGTFLSFATSFPYLQISDKGMKALTKMN